MKNLLKKSTPDKIIDATGDIAKYSLEIALYLLYILVKFISTTLWKFRQQLKTTAIYLGVFLFLYATFPYYATAPKTAHAMDGQKEMVIHTDLKVKEIVLSMGRYEFGDSEVPALEQLIAHESGFDPKALNQNSGACGLFQSLPCNKMDSMDLHDQIKFGFSYIKARYGTPSKAWAFWQAQKPHWY